jgi:hypothetical protein
MSEQWKTNPDDPLQLQVDLIRELCPPGVEPRVRIIRCTCLPGAWPCECEREVKP